MLLHTTLLLKTLGESNTARILSSSSLCLQRIQHLFLSSFLCHSSQADTPGGSILKKTFLACMKFTLTMWLGRHQWQPPPHQLHWWKPEPGRRWPSCRWLWEACGRSSARCFSGASSPSSRGGSPPASSPRPSSASSTISISWRHSVAGPAVAAQRVLCGGRRRPRRWLCSATPPLPSFLPPTTALVTDHIISAPGSAPSASSTDDSLNPLSLFLLHPLPFFYFEIKISKPW